MTDSIQPGAMLHLRGNALSPGEPVALPLVASSMFHLPGAPEGLTAYGRNDNPTWQAVEHMLAHLESAPVRLFPSGMAAITATLFATLSAGSRLLIPSDGYFVTRALSAQFLSGLGIEVVECPTSEIAAQDIASFDVIFLETPSNPGLDLIDITAIKARAKGRVIVDNTTMTPLGQRPLDLGADIVVASDTKAPGGHSDLLMGHLATRDEALMERVSDWRKLSGTIPGPYEAWLLHRGLETLELRFDRMCRSAGVIAERLQGHKALSALRYPGLEDDPAHALASRQMARFGFLLSLTLASAEQADAFINACPLLRPATSFGGVHSSAERRARWGDDVAPGFVRLSVGCEPVEELWEAISAALDAV